MNNKALFNIAKFSIKLVKDSRKMVKINDKKRTLTVLDLIEVSFIRKDNVIVITDLVNNSIRLCTEDNLLETFMLSLSDTGVTEYLTKEEIIDYLKSFGLDVSKYDKKQSPLTLGFRPTLLLEAKKE